jgi:hypothetical protein
MRKLLSLELTVFLLSVAGEASASQMVLGLDYNPNGGAAPMSAPQGLQFVIDFESSVHPGQFEEFGRQAYWADGSSGSYDFSEANSPEFVDFVQLVTNGLDDEISLLTWNDFYGGSGHMGTESAWGFGDPDLAGNQIDFIRLVVHDLTAQPYNPGPPAGDGLQWNGHITWEFWGTPLPEPAAALPLLMASLLLRRKTRSRCG